MADLSPVAGAKIYIGGTMATQTADFVESDYSTQVWTEVDGWEQMGAIGDSAALISTDLINRGRTTKQKGVANAGQMQNVFSFVNGDAGQAAMIAAAAGSNKNNYAFKIVFDDSLGANGTIKFFIGIVMNWTDAGGGANTIRNTNSTIEINSNIVTKAAA